MRIIKLAEIDKVLSSIDVNELRFNQEQAFSAYSRGNVTLPPVGHLNFEDPAGDCHIKYGCSRECDYFVIKIATGFYQNANSGLPPGDGFMAVFDKRTGLLDCLLMDEGRLTNIRTAVAGMIAAKYLAPRNVYGVGIVGTGCQSRLQAMYLKHVTACRQLWVLGRSPTKASSYQYDMQAQGFHVGIARNIEELAQNCNLIVTTTASATPVINFKMLQLGTHITAVGADNPGKQELDPGIFQHANVVVADSLAQCSQYGDIAYAIKQKVIEPQKIIELGTVIDNRAQGRNSDRQLTVADLTGIAAQDINIANLILSKTKVMSCADPLGV